MRLSGSCRRTRDIQEPPPWSATAKRSHGAKLGVEGELVCDRNGALLLIRGNAEAIRVLSEKARGHERREEVIVVIGGGLLTVVLIIVLLIILL